MTAAAELVRKYFETMDEAVSKREPGLVAWRRSVIADDIVYQNKPLRVVRGKAEHLKWSAEFVGCEFMRGRILHIAEDGDWVLTERFEEWSIGGIVAGGEIMGILEVRDGQIHTWIDHQSYFEQWRASGQLPSEFFERWS
jgi:limonene-1,2-epoxide hydrolase